MIMPSFLWFISEKSWFIATTSIHVFEYIANSRTEYRTITIQEKLSQAGKIPRKKKLAYLNQKKIFESKRGEGPQYFENFNYGGAFPLNSG